MILERIRKGDEDALKEVYLNHKNEFLKWARKQFSINNEVASDVYHDAIIAFYQNITSGRLVKLEVEIKTYLFEIGKKMLINLLKREQNLANLNTKYLSKFPQSDTSLENQHSNSHRNEMISKVFSKLNPDCQKVLTLFYADEMDMKTIAEIMGFKNSDVAKSKKNVCFKCLLDKVRDKFIVEDF